MRLLEGLGGIGDEGGARVVGTAVWVVPYTVFGFGGRNRAWLPAGITFGPKLDGVGLWS